MCQTMGQIYNQSCESLAKLNFYFFSCRSYCVMCSFNIHFPKTIDSFSYEGPQQWMIIQFIKFSYNLTIVMMVPHYQVIQVTTCQCIQFRIPYVRFRRENLKRDSLKSFPPKVSRYFYTLIILNFKFEFITVPQIYFRITS